MKTKFSTLLIMASALFLTACKKDVPVPNHSVDNINGTWTWVESTGGITGEVTNPATEGYSKTIKFTKEGIYQWYNNGELQGNTRFTLTEGSSIFTDENGYLLKYEATGEFHNTDFPTTQSVLFGEKDSLFLSDECFDCYRHVYTRK